MYTNGRRRTGAVWIAGVVLALLLGGTAGAQEMTLQVWDWPIWRADLLREYADRYSEMNPGVDVEVVQRAWETYFDQVTTAIVGGAQPDIFFFHGNGNSLLFNGLLEPLPEEYFPLDRMRDEYLQIETFLYEGKLYTLPAGVMPPLLFYNVDLLNQAGVGEIPTRWDEFIPLAKQLTKYDAAGNIVQSGFQWTHEFHDVFGGILAQHGRAILEDEGIGFDSEEGYRTIDIIADLLDAETGNLPGGTAPMEIGQGNVAMRHNYTWYVFVLANAPDVNWDVTRLPTPTGELSPAHSGGSYEPAYSVPVGLSPERREEAFRFLRWLYDQDDFLVRLNVGEGRVPAKMDLWDRPEIQDDKVIRQVAAIAPHLALASGHRASWIGQVLDNLHLRIFADRVAPRVALEMAIEEARGHWAEEPARRVFGR